MDWTSLLIGLSVIPAGCLLLLLLSRTNRRSLGHPVTVDGHPSTCWHDLGNRTATQLARRAWYPIGSRRPHAHREQRELVSR